MLKNLILFLIIIVVGVWSYIYVTNHFYKNNIITIESFVQADLSKCDTQTLITFDVDDTLITAQDALGRIDKLPLLFKILAVCYHPSLLTEKSNELITSIIFEKASQKITEPIVVDIIHDLQSRGCHVIGLTSIESGPWGIIPSIPEWRCDMLASMDINLKDHLNDETFTALPKFQDQYPKFHKGIIFANQDSKGRALGAFIDAGTTKPTHVISFDDRLTALHSIAHACKKRNIEFIGYHYTGSDKKAKPFIIKRALFQLNHLFMNQQWLTDVQADTLMQSK